ncbi:MAG: hypothetical protein DRN14_03690 [Thermoplasmata archaeon]|nr:MAG: hypothetical protein DRN14_03690 [Thermoplasmata archaeon]
MKDFKERAYLLKEEIEKALKNPDWLKEIMVEAHPEKSDDNGGVQLRIMGQIDKALEFIKKHNLEQYVSGIYKLEKDKKNRIGNYVNDRIRIYLNIQ